MTATSKSMPNPIMHIRGVVMLVNFRGLGNFANELARNMFFFVKLTLPSLPASCHKTGNFSFSDEVVEADRIAYARCESPTLPSRLGDIAFAIFVLRSKIDKAGLNTSNPQPIRDIFRQSRILDQQLMAWRISVPREWETFSSVNPDEREQPSEDTRSARAPTWLGYTASYPDLLTAKLMNHFRMHSIAIQSIHVRCANWIARYGSAEHPALEVSMTEDIATAKDSSTHLKAQNVIRTLVDGICASVPFYLDKLALKGQSESIGHDRSGGPLSKPPLAGFVLLQSLVVAYTTPGIPADQKRWILGKALEIAKHAGMDERMVVKTLDRLAASCIEAETS
ncbi:MAG: hypothetical protein ASARMPREDX12_002143 [Alectoria sarmentosa]|nr:MAG: hypothetical protein ASARMPREDX12_002143 [Alectoria sarmentosa]